MNIEEAKANIGAEVVLLEDTKPYTWEDSDGVFTHTEHSNVSKLYGALRIVSVDDCTITIKGESKYQEAFCPHHIALKEPKMQNYKIKVANEAESKEAQELLFGLGYSWGEEGKSLIDVEFWHFIANHMDTNQLFYCHNSHFDADAQEEITLPQLRDLAVLHRNDVGDATHICKDGRYGLELCGEHYIYHNDVKKWRIVSETYFTNLAIKPINDPQMTWQDALRAVADGKEVEVLISSGTFENIKTYRLINLTCDEYTFRLAPQRKELNGNFTKEELLKIVGEMV